MRSISSISPSHTMSTVCSLSAITWRARGQGAGRRLGVARASAARAWARSAGVERAGCTARQPASRCTAQALDSAGAGCCRQAGKAGGQGRQAGRAHHLDLELLLALALLKVVEPGRRRQQRQAVPVVAHGRHHDGQHQRHAGHACRGCREARLAVRGRWEAAARCRLGSLACLPACLGGSPARPPRACRRPQAPRSQAALARLPLTHEGVEGDGGRLALVRGVLAHEGDHLARLLHGVVVGLEVPARAAVQRGGRAREQRGGARRAIARPAPSRRRPAPRCAAAASCRWTTIQRLHQRPCSAGSAGQRRPGAHLYSCLARSSTDMAPSRAGPSTS
jgi:hypothetical protein